MVCLILKFGCAISGEQAKTAYLNISYSKFAPLTQNPGCRHYIHCNPHLHANVYIQYMQMYTYSTCAVVYLVVARSALCLSLSSFISSVTSLSLCGEGLALVGLHWAVKRTLFCFSDWSSCLTDSNCSLSIRTSACVCVCRGPGDIRKHTVHFITQVIM